MQINKKAENFSAFTFLLILFSADTARSARPDIKRAFFVWQLCLLKGAGQRVVPICGRDSPHDRVVGRVTVTTGGLVCERCVYALRVVLIAA